MSLLRLWWAEPGAKTQIMEQCSWGSEDSLTSAHICLGMGVLPFLALSSSEALYRSSMAF